MGRPTCKTILDFQSSCALQYLLNGFKVRDEEVRVIVGHLVLQYGHQALQAHPGVDAFLRQQLQLSCRLSKKKTTDSLRKPI